MKKLIYTVLTIFVIVASIVLVRGLVSGGKDSAFNRLCESLVESFTEGDEPTSSSVSGKSLEEQEVGRKLQSDVLSRLKGNRFEAASIEKKSEYYLLYFSASW